MRFCAVTGARVILFNCFAIFLIARDFPRFVDWLRLFHDEVASLVHDAVVVVLYAVRVYDDNLRVVYDSAYYFIKITSPE